MMHLFRRQHDEPAADGHLHLVVGLGNPGESYRRTRHNIGFRVVERLAERHAMAFKGSKQRADVARGTIAGAQVLLAEPVTFMNESGYAVSRLMSYYKVDPSRLLVICDDLDLPYGRLRVRPNGSSGGQGGLRSIIRELGTEEFARLRVGIGRGPIPAKAYVLQPFGADEEKRLPELLDVACDAAETVVREDVTAAMNRFNRDWLSPVL